MSAALAPYFTKIPLFKNLIIGSQITDETFGVAVQHAAQKGYLGERWMIGLNVTAYLNWILATIIGGYLVSGYQIHIHTGWIMHYQQCLSDYLYFSS